MAAHKAVTLKDVAELAHVSQSVVSTILNGRQNGIFVSESTRRNVIAAAEDLGYVAKHRNAPSIRKPSITAHRSGGLRESHLVGLLLGRRFGGSLFTDIFYGVNSVLSQEGYHPLVLDTYADSYTKAAEKEAEGLQYARDNRFAGVVVWHEGGASNVPLIQEVRNEMPVVAIDRRVVGVELDFVGTDNFQGAYEATKHLIDQGHTRIAHLTRLETTDAAIGRLRGYQQAITDAGLEVDPRHILLALDSGRRLNSDLIRQVFTSPNAPTAIFLLADFWAPPIYAELRQLGLRVPEDVALVGFDDVVQPGLDGLELTSMAQDFEAIGATAGHMILRRLADPEATIATTVYPATLSVRKSSQAVQKASPIRRIRPSSDLVVA
ncbi:LacI family transcriptional regulator [Capsulimonas corticalis]|uniref:LacI family transcriptional regulator n=1 Tax=Capsulimonas corticalis TaxID=2219043 RepID=A0A402CSW9_9BACT|nr:LacI family DNA-binding transcriptional regulator [Capsulimonas corticalis]BDI30931.1 LacI family transcriptional regulator [Capsulimonas corticalis]